MTNLRSDLRFAWRSLGRTPAFTFTALATLALAIGLNSAVFSLVRGLLLRALPFEAPEQLAMVFEARDDSPRNTVNPGNYLRWTEEAKSFAALSSMAAWTANLAGDGAAQADRVPIGYVSRDFFETVGARTLFGRTFAPADVAENAPEVVVLSEPLWRSRYGADRTVLGRKILVNGQAAEIVGVVGGEFDLPAGVQLWNPMAFGPDARTFNGRYLRVVGRLAPGVSIAAAQAEMEALAVRLAAERPDFNAGWSANVVSLDEHLVGDHRRALWVLLGAVGAVLLVACANLSGLQLARNAERRQELAVRSALGAGRGALARQLVVECALLVAAGAALGLLLARSVLGVLPALLPLDLPRFARIELDGAVLLFTAAIAAVATLVVAVVPAWRAARPDLVDALATASQKGGTRTVGWARGALVAGQVALSLALLAGAGLLVRSFERLSAVDTGFALDGLYAAEVHLAGPAYREPAKHIAFFEALVSRLAARGEVARVGAVSWLPLGGLGSATSYRALDQPPPPPDAELVADVRIATPGFFATAGLALERGRLFEARDAATAPPVVVINAAAARELWPGLDPIGRRVAMSWDREREAEVVGVVEDARLETVADAPRGTLYWHLPQLPNSFLTILLRANGGEVALATALREEVARLDPSVPVARLEPMRAIAARSTERPRFTSSLVALFAATALALAALGLYGVLAGAVAERRRELGIRLALGSDRAKLVGTVVARALALVGAGVAVGLPLVWLVGRWVSALLFEVEPTDPWALAAAPLLLLAVAAAASALPAWRAASTDPASVLREG